MTKTKKSWEELKRLFLVSNQSLVDFLREERGRREGGRIEKLTGYETRKTQGWVEERQTLRKQQTEKAKLQILEDTDAATLQKILLEGKYNIINSILDRVKRQGEWSLSIKELYTALTAIKIELGEPTTIQKAEVKQEGAVTLNQFLDILKKEKS
jgi:hypothetical protein